MVISGKSAVSRADLLSVFILQDEQALEKMAFALGFQAVEEKPAQDFNETLPEIFEKTNKSETIAEQKPIQRPEKLPKARFFYVAAREQKILNDQLSKSEIPEWLRQSKSLTEDACPEPGTIVLPACHELIRWPRLWPFLKTVLGQYYATRQPDIPRLINDVAKGISIRQLPMQTQHGWSPKICILLDFQNQTQPYYHDLTRLQDKLKKSHGSLGIDVRVLEGEAGMQTKYRKAGNNEVLDWKNPAWGTPLLILSDLGILAESNRQQRGWAFFGRRLIAAGCQPQVLCPVPELLLDKTLQRLFNIQSWDRHNRLRGHRTDTMMTEHIDQQSIKQLSGVETLLALLSVAVVIEPSLLRTIRLMLPVKQLNVADEAGFWQHPDISSSTQGCCFKSLLAVTQYQHQLKDKKFWIAIDVKTKVERELIQKRLVELI